MISNPEKGIIILPLERVNGGSYCPNPKKYLQFTLDPNSTPQQLGHAIINTLNLIQTSSKVKRDLPASFDSTEKKETRLSEDIIKSYEWILGALKSSGYSVDFTLESLKEIDRFFDDHSENGKPKTGGLLANSTGMRLFAIGSYVGEVIRRAYGGEWVTDDDDPEGEINISVKLSNGTVLWPVQRVMKRLKNGSEDGIYAYGFSMR